MPELPETVILELDSEDNKSVIGAMAARERMGPLPEGDGNLHGRTIAEICRGWLDYHHWFDQDKASPQQIKEHELAVSAGFVSMMDLRTTIEARIKTIKGLHILHAGCGDCCADVVFELGGKEYDLTICSRRVDNNA